MIDVYATVCTKPTSAKATVTINVCMCGEIYLFKSICQGVYMQYVFVGLGVLSFGSLPYNLLGHTALLNRYKGLDRINDVI